ncbi:MAG: phosphoribosylglycinamide formyltransferase [Prevotellaceae bacterium]|jgi:phosphoribosylglycinamide formyltransferase-1|nr:phosphoribosylglycinamide formyltransferase [Prevotellaceae bacterium]
MVNIAVFASGSGSNAENIACYFKENKQVNVSLFLTNKPDAFVVERAKKLDIPCEIFNKKDFYETNNVLNVLKHNKVDFVVLAGFLWLVPENLLEAYPRRVVNIHPALLPAYGGKGMFGDNVHRAVVENKEKQTGITIHYVNTEYDKGDIIFQAKCVVEPTDIPEMVAEKVHKLEYLHYPEVLERLLLSVK